MIIIINGAAGAGKDTFIKYVTAAARSAVHNLSTVDDVKALARCMGWDPGRKFEEDRQFLSDLKDIWTRFNNGPFESVKMRILLGRILHNAARQGRDSRGIIFFVHCREPEEIEKFKNAYGSRCRTVLIRRNGIAKYHNRADRGVENYGYEIVVDNHRGVDALRGKAFALAAGWDAEAAAWGALDRRRAEERSRNIWKERSE